MVSLFKTANPVLLLALVAIGVILNVNLFIYNVPFQVDTTAPLSELILQFLSGLPNWLHKLLFIIYTIATGVYLSRVLGKHQITQSFNFVAGLFFITFISLINVNVYLSPIFISLPFFIFFIDRLLSTIFSDNNLSNSFDIGLAAGCLTMFYWPYGILLIVALLAYIYLTNFYWRYWVLILLGFTAILFTAFCSFLLFNNEMTFVTKLLSTSQSSLFLIDFNLKFFIQIASLLILLIVLILFRNDKMFKLTMAFKKFYLSLLALFIIFLIAQFLHTSFSFELLLLNFLIAIIFISTFANQQKNELFINVAHLLLILVVFYVQFFF